MRTIITFFLLTLTPTVFAQNLVWAKQFLQQPGIFGGNGNAIVTDASGNVYSGGSLQGTTDFDPGPGVYNLGPGFDNGYISKLDANGNFVWAKELNGESVQVLTIALDVSGNVYAAGQLAGSSDFDPGPGVYTLTSSNAGSVSTSFICKLDNNGNFIWAKLLGSFDDCYVNIWNMVIDNSGNVITTGILRGTADFDPGLGVYNLVFLSSLFYNSFVSKLDANGNFIFAKMFSGMSTHGYGVCVDNADNIYLSGGYAGVIDLDPGPAVFSLPAISGAYITKIDAAGNFIWGEGTSGNFQVYSMCIGNSAITLVGFFNGTIDIDPGVAVNNITAAGGADIYILQLDLNGNFQWARTMGGVSNDFGRDISTDTAGNIYITGDFSQSIDIDPGPATLTLTSSAIWELFVAKFNSSGNLVWGYQSVGTDRQQGFSCAADLTGNVYVTGHFNQTVDFDPGPATYNLTSGAHDWEAYVLKLNSCGNATSSSLSASACNSYIFNSQIYTTSGIYTQTLVNNAGCDSIITLNLIINQPTTNSISATACNSYTLNTQTYTTSGIYMQTLTNSAGCDSIISLNLNINPATVNNLYATACNSYILNSQTYTTSGTYTQTLMNSAGCDSILTLNLVLNPATVISIYDTASVNYNWEGQTYTSSGTYSATFTGAGGCDSIRILHLLIKQNVSCMLTIPNAFTPNRDGINDHWIIPIANTSCFKQVDVFVYNRYGTIVFQRRNYQSDWNGTYITKPVPDATYYYVVKAIDMNGKEKLFKGNLTILR